MRVIMSDAYWSYWNRNNFTVQKKHEDKSQSASDDLLTCDACNGTGCIAVCCNRPVVGGSYMGMDEIICCGEPDASPCEKCGGKGKSNVSA